MKRIVVLLVVAFLVGPVIVPANAVTTGTDRLYTTDADFNEGVLADVNHDDPNHDQLQLDVTSTFFPFVNIAVSGRDTVARVNVDTGQVVGEYLTRPNGRGGNPSRTTVDRLGNVWVTNRNETGSGQGSVARIGVTVGGTRSDSSGTPDPAGQFLAPPFAYNTCQDRNGDGLIRTSMGLMDVLPWTNAGLVDSDGGVETAADECITIYTRVAGTATRTVAVDSNNNVWVGGFGDRDHELLNGTTGQPIAGTQFNNGCGGYGGLVDKDGRLWSASLGGGPLLRRLTGTLACLPGGFGNYGLGLDPNTGHVWHTFVTGPAGVGAVAKIDPASEAVLGVFPHGSTHAQGVAVDRNGNVWVAHSLIGPSTTVGHLRTDGTYVGNVSLPGGAGPTGVAVDSNGNIWVANISTNNAMRINPNLGPIGGGGFPVGEVDLVVNLGPGASPYNYSDMTGSVLGNITAPFGTWTVVQDGGAAGMPWGTVTWNTESQGTVPPGTSITVEVRAADTLAGLAGQAFMPAANGALFSLSGRFIEVRATLQAAPNGDSPVLSDLRITAANRPPDCSHAMPTAGTLWPPKHNMVPVAIVGVTDEDGDVVSITVESIHQDEPVDTTGDGRFAPDGSGVGTSIAQVRAERSGSPKVPGNGRFYHIAFTASDGVGGMCSGTVNVVVPHDMAKTPQDGGPIHDSTTMP